MLKSTPDTKLQKLAQGSHYVPQQPPEQQVQPQVDLQSFHLYNLALTNRWPYQRLLRHTAPFAPVFIYCTLMLPWVLANVLGSDGGKVKQEEAATRMTSATLRGFARAMIKYAGLPTIVRKRKGKDTDEGMVQGRLVGSVDDSELKKIESYIGMDEHERDTVEVEVTVQSGEKAIVAAYVYAWNGAASMLEDRHWSPIEYMKGGRQGVAE